LLAAVLLRDPSYILGTCSRSPPPIEEDFMTSSSIPAELLTLRDGIDEIDAEILRGLANRFALTLRVGELKAAMNLEPFDGAREAEKLARLRALAAELGVSAELTDELFSRIMREAVENHRRLKAERA
jgi:chorismate mutase